MIATPRRGCFSNCPQICIEEIEVAPIDSSSGPNNPLLWSFFSLSPWFPKLRSSSTGSRLRKMIERSSCLPVSATRFSSGVHFSSNVRHGCRLIALSSNALVPFRKWPLRMERLTVGAVRAARDHRCEGGENENSDV